MTKAGRDCTLEVPIYPKFDRMFFENLRIGTECIISSIKGTLIVLDERRINSILAMLRASVCFLALEKKINGLKVILETDDVRNLKNLQANQLFMKMRLLHDMVNRIFF